MQKKEEGITVCLQTLEVISPHSQEGSNNLAGRGEYKSPLEVAKFDIHNVRQKETLSQLIIGPKQRRAQRGALQLNRHLEMPKYCSMRRIE